MQVELAQLEYNMARMRGLWTHLERLGAGRGVGGIGTRGPGESQIETDRRLARDRITVLKRRLDQVKAHPRDPARRARARAPAQRRARRLHERRQVDAAQRADRAPRSACATGCSTRWTRRRARCGSHGRTYLMTDTVGFIRKLPHQLVDAFAATLEETRLADLVLHVVDASAPEEELRRDDPRGRGRARGDRRGRLAAHARAQQGRPARRRAPPRAQLPPPGRRAGLRASPARAWRSCGERIAAEFERTLRDVELLVPVLARAGLLSELHDVAGDMEREDTPEGVRVTARLPAVVAERFDRYAVNGR